MKIGILYDSCGNIVGGQVTKNQNVIQFFQNQKDDVDLCDVYGLGKKKIILLWKKLKRFCRNNDNIVLIMGIHNFVYIIILLYFLKKKQKIYYLTIGGDNHFYLKKHPLTRYCCKIISRTYTETKKHQKEIQEIGLLNVSVMPSCRNFEEIAFDEYQVNLRQPLPVCTFSRVCREKGIGTAAEAVFKANQVLRKKAYVLNIYGPVAEEYQEEMTSLLNKCNGIVQYKGVVNRNAAHDVLKEHFLLLFPTVHSGEGFPSTILDAYAAGIPVIASNQNALPEIIIQNKTGYIVKEPYLDEIIELLVKIYKEPECILHMRKQCIEEVKKYDTFTVLKQLRNDILEDCDDES